jgi:phosphate transport system substrate-binding protein
VNIKRISAIAAVVGASALVLAGCASNGTDSGDTPSSAPSGPDYSSLSGTITAGGSSAQGNAEKAWIAAFNSLASGVTVNYDQTQGSGGGKANFIAGSYDFAGSDAALTADETTKAAATFPSGSVDLPIYLDGVAVAYNLAGQDKLNLTTPTIAKIFSGKITDWSDPAIAADNGGTALPAGKITVVVRSDGSGTAFNFTNFLHGADPADWAWEGSTTFPTDITGTDPQKGGGAVAAEVAKVAGSIGFVDHSAAKDASGKDLQAATVNGIAFSSDAVSKAVEVGSTTTSNGVDGDLSVTFDYGKITADKSAYPIPLISYAILPLEFKDAAQAKITVAYLQFVASEIGQKAAASSAGAVPLPKETLDAVNKTLASIK